MADEQRFVVVRQNGRFVHRVDPRTRQSTDEPQQFRAIKDAEGDGYTLATRAEWVTNPLVMDVDTIDYR